ncbi:MAG TPA: DJ-1/PfpI family protein [Pseudonocardiaceae bacterium]|nr:DJ-1/PfpI family protein [Pseudonocardiaceae bacterium]
MHTVLITLFDNVQSLDVTGPLEVFTTANAVTGTTAYRTTTATHDGRPVHTSSGLTITPDTHLAAAPPANTLVVPGGPGTRQPQPHLVHWLRHHATTADRLVSVCTGAFLLAAAGLLPGRTVTTHWAHCDQLARQHPDLTVDPQPLYLRDGNVITSAGVTSGIDLALALVEDDHDRDTALAVARELVVFLRRPGNQTQFTAPLRTHTAHRAPLRDVQQWITDHPDADLTVHTLAERANLSPRQFARAFTAETGATPGQYVDHTRLETARRLLEDTDHPIDHVARHSGYHTTEAMRRAFHRTLGTSPAEYRRRF